MRTITFKMKTLSRISNICSTSSGQNTPSMLCTYTSCVTVLFYVSLHVFPNPRYPHCFYFLDLLQDENFRKLATKPHFISLLLDQQNLHWKFYRSKRMRQEAEASNTPPNILPQQDDAMEQTNPVNVNM